MSDHPTPQSIVPRVWYIDPVLDTEALAFAGRGSAVYSCGYLPTLVVRGRDRASWLNGLLTCDVSVVRSEVAAWGLLLDRVGKIQAVLGIVAHAETLVLGVLWGDAQEVNQQLDMRLVMEDAELEVVDDWHWTVGVGAAPEVPSSAAWGNLDFAGACSLIAEPTFAERSSRHALSDAAWALWRMHCALPWGGIDFDGSARPHDAGLDRKAVSWSKGCYLGQEVVCMQDMRGKVKKRLAVFTTQGDSYASRALGSSVRHGDAEVGRVTSGVYEPVEGRWTLFALVPTSALPDSGGQVTADGGHDGPNDVDKTDLTWEPTAGSRLSLRWVR